MVCWCPIQQIGLDTSALKARSVDELPLDIWTDHCFTSCLHLLALCLPFRNQQCVGAFLWLCGWEIRPLGLGIETPPFDDVVGLAVHQYVLRREGRGGGRIFPALCNKIESVD